MVQNSFSKVKSVGFNEKIDIFGAITAEPLSTGHLIGAANWLIRTDYEKIVYVSSSSTLTSHPAPFDRTGLSKPDLLIATNLNSVSERNPDQSLNDVLHNISE